MFQASGWAAESECAGRGERGAPLRAESEFYLEHPDLRERVPLTFGEEFALVRLLGYCGFV